MQRKAAQNLHNIALGTLLLLLPSCTSTDESRCTKLFDAKDYESAVQSCRQEYKDSGEFRAGDHWAKALFMLGDHDGVVELARHLESGPSGGTAWHLAGIGYTSRGKPDRALDAYNRALMINRRHGRVRNVALDACRIATLHWDKSEYRQALNFGQISYRAAKQTDDPRTLVSALLVLVEVLYDMGDLEDVQGLLDDNREVLEANKHHGDVASIKTIEGLLHFRAGRHALALDSFEHALKLARKAGYPHLLRTIHLNIVETCLETGDLADAKHHLAEARKHADPAGNYSIPLDYNQGRLALAQGHQNEAVSIFQAALEAKPVPTWKWQIADRLGQAAEKTGNLEVALRAYQLSTQTLETMRKHVQVDHLKHWLLTRQRRPYESLFLLQAKAGHFRDALQTVERVKSRTFLDAFIHRNEKPDTRWSHQVVVDRADALEAILPLLTSSPVAKPRPVVELLNALGSRHVLVYFAAREDLWVIGASARRIVVERLPKPLSEIESLAMSFMANPDDRALATTLGKTLLPRALLPRHGSRISIVTDGPLGMLPYSALRNGDRFLVEEYVISYVPSVSALVSLSKNTRAGFDGAVVMGDPRQDLPGAKTEIARVADILGTRHLTGAQADHSGLSQAASARVLHLATHAGIGPKGPWLELYDGKVTTGTVLSARLGPRLVVLAGCASAARQGQDMWGSLGAAFLASGSQSVFATLRSVRDETTTPFIIQFYQQGGPDDPALALAKVQRAAIANGRPPSQWSPFVLFGTCDSSPQ